MALTFRNLTVSPDDPVVSWPTEAIQTALERGDLDDWRRIAAELSRDPRGRVARRVEEVLRFSRPYGVANAFEPSSIAFEPVPKLANEPRWRPTYVALSPSLA